MIGMAAGIAGDEIEDIAKYTGAGVGIGGTLGYKAASSTGSFISDSYYEGAYNDEEKIEKYKDERSKDKDLQQKIANKIKHEDGSKLTKAELREKAREVADYEVSGLEEKDAIKATKMEAEVRKALMEKGEIGEEEAGKQARINMEIIAKEAANYPVKELRKKEVQTQFIKTMASKFKDSGCSPKDAVNQATQLLGMVMKFKKA